MPINTSSKSGNPIWRLLMFVLALTVMPIYEGAKWLSDKVYSRWTGALRAVLGVGFGVTAAIGAGHFLGWQHNFSTWIWLPGALLSFAATLWYAWPISYLIVVKPIWKAADWYSDKLRDFSKGTFKSATAGFINLLRHAPGSDGLWKAVLDRQRRSWVLTIVYAVSYVSTILGSVYLGWSTYGWVMNALHLGAVNYALAGGAGLAVFLFAVTTLWQFTDHGETPFITIATGIVGVHYFHATTNALLAQYGFPPVLNWPAYVVEFVLYTTYLFPLVNVILTNGFWKWLIDTIKPLFEKVYEENKGDYRALFHHLVNFGAAFGFTKLALLLCGALSLGTPITVAVAVVVALLSYILVFKALDHDGGNGIVGFGASATAAWFAGKAYFTAGLLYGVYGAIVVGVAAGTAAFLVGFPALYLLVRLIANPLLGWASKPLSTLHGKVWGGFKEMVKELESVYENSYRDKAPFKDLFLHVGNLAVTAGVGYLALQAGHALTLGTILSWSLVVLLAGLSYLLVGKLLLKVGMDAFGVISSLAASIYVGALTYGAQSHGLWVAVPVALVAGGFVAYLAFPIGYVLVRTLTSWALTGWLLPLLSNVYDFCWKLFMVAWDQFVAMYRWVKELVTPFFRAIAELWLSVWKSVKDAWASISRKKA